MVKTLCINELLKNEKSFRALTGVSCQHFHNILPYFIDAVDNYFERYTISGKPRKNKFHSKTDQLSSYEEKLFFILYYLKNNPTQESIALTFGLKQDMCNKWIHLLTKLLNKALKDFKPEENALRFSNQLSENEEYILDVTERPVQRDTYVQEEYYNGKKKRIH